MVRFGAATLWLLATLAALNVVTARTWAFAKRDYAHLAPPPLADARPAAIDLLTLGHRELYDDLIYLWTLQTLVDPATKASDPLAVQRVLLKVTRHQPRIETLYMLACFVLAFDLKRPDLCEPVLLDGLKANPAGWRIPLTQGFLYAFELKDPRYAAMYYGLAASRPDAPAFVGRYALKLIETNTLSLDDLATTLSGLMSADAGARLSAYLKDLAVRAEERR